MLWFALPSPDLAFDLLPFPHPPLCALAMPQGNDIYPVMSSFVFSSLPLLFPFLGIIFPVSSTLSAERAPGPPLNQSSHLIWAALSLFFWHATLCFLFTALQYTSFHMCLSPLTKLGLLWLKSCVLFIIVPRSLLWSLVDLCVINY